MNCEEVRSQLDPFLSGRLSGAESRSLRLHLASCPRCGSALQSTDRIEFLTAMDEEIEPSDDLQARFVSRLEAHRARYAAQRSGRSWRSPFLDWGVSQKLAAAGILAAFLALGLYFGMFRPQEPVPGEWTPQGLTDMTVAENLPLLEDMRIIERLDLLEDFETIQDLSNMKSPSTAQ